VQLFLRRSSFSNRDATGDFISLEVPEVEDLLFLDSGSLFTEEEVGKTVDAMLDNSSE
jgi:hypothetical protein